MSSEKSGSAGDHGRNKGFEHRTSCFEPSEGILASLPELAMLKEPHFRLFYRGLNLGVAMDIKVAVGDEIWNNDIIGCGGSLCDDLCNRDWDRSGFWNLDNDRSVGLRTRTSRRPESMKDSRDAILESPGHSSYPKRRSGGNFLSRHLRQNGEEPRSGGKKPLQADNGPQTWIDIAGRS